MFNIQIIQTIFFILALYVIGCGVWTLMKHITHLDVNKYIDIAMSWVFGNATVMILLYPLALTDSLFYLTQHFLTVSIFIILLVGISIRLLHMFRHQKEYIKSLQKFSYTDALMLCIVLFLLRHIFIHSVYSFTFEWDTIALWFMKAKALFYFNGVLENPYFSLNEISTYSSKSYPIGLPLMIATYYRFLNTVQDQLVQVYMVQFYLAGILLMWGLMQKYASKLNIFSRGLLLLTYATMPLYVHFSHIGYADIPIGLLFATSMFLFLEKRYTLACLVASISLLLKNEGLVFFVAMFSVSSLYFIFSRFYLKKNDTFKQHKPLTLISLLIGLCVLLLSFKFHALVSSQGVISNLTNPLLNIENIRRIPYIYNQFFSMFLNTNMFGISFLVLAVLTVLSITNAAYKNSFEWLFGLTIIVLLSIGYALVYVITPFPLQFHIDSSLPRLFIQLYSTWAVYVIYQWRHML